jgi:hypothetical protein
MIPGNGQQHGPIPGYRPVGSARNGLPEGTSRGYRRLGDPNWDPWNGSHHDPSVVSKAPRRPVPPSAARSRSVKLSEYCGYRDEGWTMAEAAELTGIAESTAEKYERGYRAAKAAASPGGAP